MPVIEESRGFRSPDLDDDADSYGTQDSGEFGIIPAEEELLHDMRDDFSVRTGVLCDGYIDTDGNDLVYRLTDHLHFPMVDCYAISHLFLYIITYKYTNESLTLNMKGLCT